MSADYSTIRLDQLGPIVTGKTPSNSVENAYSINGTPFITPKDMDGRKWIDATERYLSLSGLDAVKKSLVPRNSVAVSCIGSDMGKAVMVERDSVTNQQINTIIVNSEKWNPEYIYYLLTTKQQPLKDIAGGSATPILNKGHFGKVEIDVPSKEIQDKVAKILSALDEKIRLNTQTNQTLEQIAQAIFKSWFVDFDPVKAKIAVLEAGGTAEQAELAAMSAISAKDKAALKQLQAEESAAYAELAQTAALFPSKMVDSELGEIPEGWEVTKIEYLLTRLKAKRTFTKKQVEPYGLVPVFEQGAGILLGFHNDNAGFKATPEEPIFIFGDHTCITHLSCEEFDISSNVIPLKGSIRPTIWTYYAILGKQTFQEYRRHWSEFIVKESVLPPNSLAERFTEQVTTFYLQIERLGKEIMVLKQIRDSLLPKLLSGELPIPETDEATA